MYKKALLALAACTTLLFSCKKDSKLNDSRLAGTWIYQGSYLDADFIDYDDTNVILKGMTINNTGELTFDPVTDSFHFSNYYYEIDLPRTNIIHTSNKGDSTYIDHLNFKGSIANIPATYAFSGKNTLKIAGILITKPVDMDVPAGTWPEYKSEFTVGWAGDTLLLLDNFTSIQLTMLHNATLKFVKK